MTHLFNREMIVISLNSDLSSEELILKEIYKHLFIYSTTNLKAVKKQINIEHYVEYLDSFLFVLPEDYSSQSIIWEDFYSRYADSFESITDIGHNILCIKKIYALIQKRMNISSRTKVLDFGCGSGLAIHLNAECDLIGYEPNEKMRKQARAKGMKVLDANQICMLPDNSIDAVFSSYVFHMGIKEHDIELLRRIIRQDGMIVANFYKNMNCLVVNDIFACMGFSVTKINEFDERFGSVYEYRKK